MRITIVSASPKKRYSTTMYFSKILKLFLLGHRVKIIKLSSVCDYNDILLQLPNTDVLVFSFPIYVDAIPSTVLEYLHKLQKDIAVKNYAIKVYGINVCGFYEGRQCHLSLDILKTDV